MNNEEIKIVAIVMPDIGLFDDVVSTVDEELFLPQNSYLFMKT